MSLRAPVFRLSKRQRSACASLSEPVLALSRPATSTGDSSRHRSSSLPFCLMLTHPVAGPKPDWFKNCKRSPMRSTCSMTQPCGSRVGNLIEVGRWPFCTRAPSWQTTAHWLLVPTIAALRAALLPSVEDGVALTGRTTAAGWSGALRLAGVALISTSPPLASRMLTHPERGPTPDSLLKCKLSPKSASSSTMAPLGRRSGSS
mmetsp:Transcript_77713/g.214785  ORF Transcript_77713/g.214785 Transcript_77713/m.214785 type:complete len:203 (-) Transcript_77713:59-667(-)